MPAAEEPVRLGRKRALPACPNPLFLQWLTELRDQAKEKGQKAQHTYQKAINSLNKYPLPLQTAKEAKILQNFGDGICKMLDERLQRYYRENGPNASIHSLPNAAPPPGKSVNSSLAPRRKSKILQGEGKAKGEQRKGRKQREYVPQKRSGGHAVLLALYRHSQIIGDKGFMFKMELQTQAQPLCDKSFTVPELGSKYTAWSTVSTLIQKNLLLKTHNPARYCLTEEGVALAARLEPPEQRGAGEGESARGRRGERDTEEEESGSKGEVEEKMEYEGDAPGVVDLTLDEEEQEEEQEEERVWPAACLAQARREPAGQSDPGRAQASSTASARPDAGRLLPGSYEIVLCVDFIETTGGNGHRKQELATELESNNVTFDIRKLNVGDFLWVAREKVQPIPGRAPSGRELVLDYIVERKRMDDLCGSIIDGRFREQKFRLKRCGLKKPIYLVEECGTAASRLSIPESTLQQAIVNTQVVDGFFVKRVQDVKESAGYLAVMTRHLARLYQNCTLVCRSRELEGDGGAVEERGGGISCSLMSFSEFNHGALKNKSQTVRELFARQLMQISGLSGDKAAAILELYSTPCSLFSAYDRCSSETEKEKLLSAIKCGKFQRNLGPALSRTVYQLYCASGALS